MGEVNNASIKFSGHSFETMEEISNGTDLVFQGKGSVVRQNRRDNQDGTETVVSILQPEIVEVKRVTATKEMEDILKRHTSSKMSLSQELRFWIEKEAELKETDPKEYYKGIMTKAINKKRADVQVMEDK